MTPRHGAYRRLGRAGLQLSVLSFGSWVTFDQQLKDDLAMECMQAAYDAGCNFFDNAEAYAGGESEAIMGRVLAELGWPRWSYVLTTKVFWGLHDAPNMRNTLNRKYLMQAIDGSLERLQHRLRRHPLLPSVRPGHDARGDGVGDERHRVGGQGPLLGHERVDRRRDPGRDRDRRAPPPAQAGDRAAAVQPAARASASSRSTPGCSPTSGYGATTWSPLASGLLTGKYRDGIPRGLTRRAGGLRLAGRRRSPTREAIAKVERAAPDRRRARLLAGPAGDRLVRGEPATCRR